MSTTTPATSPPATMNLSIVNPAGSGAPDDQIYVCILGLDPSNGSQFGYLNLAVSPPVMVSGPTFTYVPGTTSQTLAQITATLGASFPVPPIQSARIYFAIGADFDPSQMSPSGPSPSKTNSALFDFVEFDTSSPGNYNINPTTVDFYGISYTVQATPNGASAPVTVGFDRSRQEVVDALRDIPRSPSGQCTGNLDIFRDCIVTEETGAGTLVLRVLSPKTMALTDWGPITNVERATQCSHFFDKYVNDHCYTPGRTLTFYTKNYTPGGDNSANQIWAQVSADGFSMNLFTDKAMTQPYQNVPNLLRPSAPWPLPDFTTPSNYHNVSGLSASDVDWGFLLIGNVASGYGIAYPWGVDPAAMAVMVSIDRGVAHRDDGTTTWVDPAYYYLGDGSGVSTPEMPILYYAKVLHHLGLNGQAYALSFDDVYGQQSSITFADGGAVTVTLCGVGPAEIPPVPRELREEHEAHKPAPAEMAVAGG